MSTWLSTRTVMRTCATGSSISAHPARTDRAGVPAEVPHEVAVAACDVILDRVADRQRVSRLDRFRDGAMLASRPTACSAGRGGCPTGRRPRGRGCGAGWRGCRSGRRGRSGSRSWRCSPACSCPPPGPPPSPRRARRAARFRAVTSAAPLAARRTARSACARCRCPRSTRGRLPRSAATGGSSVGRGAGVHLAQRRPDRGDAGREAQREGALPSHAVPCPER